jgi:heme exporter protein D
MFSDRSMMGRYLFVDWMASSWTVALEVHLSLHTVDQKLAAGVPVVEAAVVWAFGKDSRGTQEAVEAEGRRHQALETLHRRIPSGVGYWELVCMVLVVSKASS